MAEKKNKPEIRFSGFIDSWEQRKFSEIFKYERPDKYIVKSVEYNDNFETPVLTANKGFILGYTNEKNIYNNESIIFDDFTLDSKYIDFSYMVKSSAIKILTIKNSKNDNLKCAYYLLNSANVESLGHARHYISIVQNTKVFTSKIAEQNKIASIIGNVDNLITLHQRKCEKLKIMKKSLLEKMFPKNGQNIPEVRFSNFTEPWEQRKLGEIVKINSGRDYKHLKEGIIPVYGTGGYMLSVNDKLSDRDAIGIGRKGTIDKPQLLKSPFWTVDTLFFLTSNKLYLNFLFSLTQKIKWKKYDESTGVPSLSKINISNISAFIPSNDSEQKKIGESLNEIDTLITLHQRKLDKLQNIKKSLLEKMFV